MGNGAAFPLSRIKVRFSFLAFMALVFLLRDTGVILSFFVVCIIHEAGHCLAIWATGGRIRSVELSCFGVRITADPPEGIWDGTAVLLSGPAVNIAVYIVSAAAGRNGYFPMLNLAEGLFNLLPFPFLDGGALLELYITGSIYERDLRIVMRGLQAAAVIAAVYVVMK